jgi:hypothetical protein
LYLGFRYFKLLFKTYLQAPQLPQLPQEQLVGLQEWWILDSTDGVKQDPPQLSFFNFFLERFWFDCLKHMENNPLICVMFIKLIYFWIRTSIFLISLSHWPTRCWNLEHETPLFYVILYITLTPLMKKCGIKIIIIKKLNITNWGLSVWCPSIGILTHTSTIRGTYGYCWVASKCKNVACLLIKNGRVGRFEFYYVYSVGHLSIKIVVSACRTCRILTHMYPYNWLVHRTALNLADLNLPVLQTFIIILYVIGVHMG